jgi:hypothetical protein
VLMPLNDINHPKLLCPQMNVGEIRIIFILNDVFHGEPIMIPSPRKESETA